MTDEKSIFSNPDTFHEALNKIQNQIEVSPQPEQESIPNDVVAAQEAETAQIEQSEPSPQGNDQSEQEVAEKPEKGHLIPKSRFNEVVSKQKAAEEELQRTREDKVRLETQLQMFAEMQKAQQQQYTQQEPEIDPLDTDTYNYAKKEITELRGEIHKMSQQIAEQQRVNQMQNEAAAQEAQFNKDHPDFKDAFAYLREVELNVAKTLIPDARQAEAMVDQKIRDTIAISINNKQNAAETIYNIAKNYGYSEKGKAIAKNETSLGANLDAISKNMQNSRSINDVGNSANISNPVPADILSALAKPGNLTSGVDSTKFHAMLEKLEKNKLY
jgi:hypothetical protein